MKEDNGILTLVATPIGNLEDITLRAINVLKEADLIAAEDTRQTLKLLNHFNINKPLTSYHEHNKYEKGKYLIAKLLEGEDIALVTDAGTPGISDPGEELVKLAVENGIKVTMAPGPAAAVMGLVLSGLPTGRFVFEGFLPTNNRDRKERLEMLRKESRTIILYEAPHRLEQTLTNLYKVFGEREVAICRELTKKFEEVIRTSLSKAVEMFSTQKAKGEMVIILKGTEKDSFDQENCEWADLSLRDHVEKYMGEGMEKKEAMKKVAEIRKISKRDVYKSLIEQ